MKIEEKEILLRDGRACILKSPEPREAAEMLDYLKGISAETYFMVRYPDEVTMTLEEEKEFLERHLTSGNSFMLAAYLEGRLAGNIAVNGVASTRKMCHRASLGIAVRKDYWGLGIGGVLIESALHYARELGYEQLELGVFDDNGRARHLYRKLGFEEWGVTKRAFRLEDGSYRDEIMMGRLL